MTHFTLIIPVKDVPVDSVITKVTGSKEYKVKDSVRIFSDKIEDRQEIKAQPGVRFICAMTTPGDINAIGGDTNVAWTVSKEELLNYIHDLDGSHQ